MKMFKKNMSAARDRAVGKLSGSIRKGFGVLKRRWAEWMNRKMNGRSKRTLLIGLSLFVTASVLYNGWILIGSPTRSELRFGNIHVPDKTQQPKALENAYSMELKRIGAFRKYMDSLYHSESGRPTYDSIMKARPGLLDSARVIENIVGK